jgi:hypothetical protein
MIARGSWSANSGRFSNSGSDDEDGDTGNGRTGARGQADLEAGVSADVMTRKTA